MSEDDIQQVRRIAKETALEVFDEEVLGALVEAFSGLEAIAVQFKHSIGSIKGVSVREETFNCLSYEKQTGNRIGEFEVAYKKNNIPDKFRHAYNILMKNNATISNRYHSGGYVFGYWLYGEDKIYRQKLKAPNKSS